MTVGVPKEILENERRVALTPAGAQILSKIGYGVKVEAAAGTAAKFSDEMFTNHGATVTNKSDVLSSDIIFKVRYLYRENSREKCPLNYDEILFFLTLINVVIQSNRIFFAC